MWPSYSAACRNSINLLLQRGGSLSAYKANKLYGAEPALGSWAQRLESQLAMRMGVKYAVATNSGTGALQAAIVSALGEPRGKARNITVSPYTFSASAAAILLSGYTPVFADVDPETFCITPETVKQTLTKETAAILPVSLFGGMADVRGMRALGCPVIEDACQAVGARDRYGCSGSQATIAVYSMNGGKNIPAGECGAILTNSHKVSEAARMVVNHGENFGMERVGFNFRPNELTTCVAYHGLMELGENNRQRIQLAEALTSMIRASQRLSRFIEVPESVKFDGSHVFYVYPFRIKNLRRKLFAARMLNKFGITVGEGYVVPLHNKKKYPAFAPYYRGRLPVVEKLSGESLCLFSHVTPGNTVKDMERTVDAMEVCVRDHLH